MMRTRPTLTLTVWFAVGLRLDSVLVVLGFAWAATRLVAVAARQHDVEPVALDDLVPGPAVLP